MYVESSCQGYSGLASDGIPSHRGSFIASEYLCLNISGVITASTSLTSSSDGQISLNMTGEPSLEKPRGSLSKSISRLPAIAYATTNGGLAKYEALTLPWTLPSKFLLPDITDPTISPASSMALSISSGNGPELPIHVVQPYPTTLKPIALRSSSKPVA